MAGFALTELDLLVIDRGNRFGFEFKFSDASDIPKSMLTAFDDLGLDRLTVLYPGDRAYPLRDRIQVLPLSQYEPERA